jgi:5'-3' exonuclease
VPGIGEKTAASLVTKYGSVDAMLDDVSKVAAHRAYVEAARVVVEVAKDVPLPDLDDKLCATPRDPARLVALSERWGLDSSLNRLLHALDVTCGTA